MRYCQEDYKGMIRFRRESRGQDKRAADPELRINREKQ